MPAVPVPVGPLDPAALDPDGEIEVWAAGVILRRRAARDADVLVVYRPRRDDWTLPKGKVDPGETLVDCARRELREETGYECDLGPALAPLRYQDGSGRSKAVVYFLAVLTGGEFTHNDEVSIERWLSPTDAVELLTYPRDRALLQSVLSGSVGSFIWR